VCRIRPTLILIGIAALLAQAQKPGKLAGLSEDRSREAYTLELSRLVTALQKNPWSTRPTGTEVLIRYLVDRDAAGKPLGAQQPDILFKVTEADRSFITTQVDKGRMISREFFVKDQGGLDLPQQRFDQEPAQTELKIDGVNLACLRGESTWHEWSDRGPSSRVTRQWVLASHPSIVLRQEVAESHGWEVTSARVNKRIGEREFQCVEIRKWLRFYHKGPNDSVTTQYLCPEVPGHVAEEIERLFKVQKGRRSSAPYQLVHQRVVELKIPN